MPDSGPESGPESGVVPPAPGNRGSGDTHAGFLYALAAYGLWGFLPLYMKALAHVNAVEVVAHRVLWSVPVAGIILWWIGRTREILPTLKSPRRLAILLLTASIISLNWVIYVWAIATDRTLETALGYYINPLISVAMGVVLLGEGFTRPQLIAIALATLAVLLLAVAGGGVPWVSLVLAFSFATYGFLRKTADIGPTQGFLIEVLLLLPFAIAIASWFRISGSGVDLSQPVNMLLLLGCGPVTAIPLILYAFGAKGLRLSTIGLMQYIAPTMIFLIGVFVFGEPFTGVRIVAFVLIWTALAIYSWSAIRR